MSNYRTFGQLAQDVREDTDSIEQDFITDSLMRQYFNDAVDRIEADIQKYELDDYFLAYRDFPYQAGMREISLPRDIYIHKVRSLVFYEAGVDVYTLRRLRNLGKFEVMGLYEVSQSTNYSQLSYFLTNEIDVGPKILLTPTNYDGRGGETFIRMWYRRQIKKMEDVLNEDGSVQLDASSVECDIPEFHYALKFYVKSRIYDKADEVGAYERAMAQYVDSMKTMTETIENMMPDGQNLIYPDMSYHEQSEGGNDAF